MDNFIDYGKLKQNLYSFYFSENPAFPGFMSMGKIDHSKIEGPVQWAKVTSNERWNVELADVKDSNGYSLGLCPNGCTALVDTGKNGITTMRDEFWLRVVSDKISE